MKATTATKKPRTRKAAPVKAVAPVVQDEEVVAPPSMAKLNAYRKLYVKGLHTGDAVAMLLEGKDVAVVVEIAAAILGVTEASIFERYEHLNNGQVRMNSGNRMRAAIKKDPALLRVVLSMADHDEDEAMVAMVEAAIATAA